MPRHSVEGGGPGRAPAPPARSNVTATLKRTLEAFRRDDGNDDDVASEGTGGGGSSTPPLPLPPPPRADTVLPPPPDASDRVALLESLLLHRTASATIPPASRVPLWGDGSAWTALQHPPPTQHQLVLLLNQQLQQPQPALPLYPTLPHLTSALPTTNHPLLSLSYADAFVRQRPASTQALLAATTPTTTTTAIPTVVGGGGLGGAEREIGVGLPILAVPLPTTSEVWHHSIMPQPVGWAGLGLGGTVPTLVTQQPTSSASFVTIPVDRRPAVAGVAAFVNPFPEPPLDRAASLSVSTQKPSIVNSSERHAKHRGQTKPRFRPGAGRDGAVVPRSAGRGAKVGSPGRPSPRGRAIPMSRPEDATNASQYQCLLRQQIEFFVTDDESLRAKAQGRNVPVRLGQVGIRCVHCAAQRRRGSSTVARGEDTASSEMVRGAVYYPARTESLYQAVQNMANNHFTGSTCPSIHRSVLGEILEARRTRPRRSCGKGKRYFSESAEALGIVNAPEGSTGLVLKDELSVATSSSPPRSDDASTALGGQHCQDTAEV